MTVMTGVLRARMIVAQLNDILRSTCQPASLYAPAVVDFVLRALLENDVDAPEKLDSLTERVRSLIGESLAVVVPSTFWAAHDLRYEQLKSLSKLIGTHRQDDNVDCGAHIISAFTTISSEEILRTLMEFFHPERSPRAAARLRVLLRRRKS